MVSLNVSGLLTGSRGLLQVTLVISEITQFEDHELGKGLHKGKIYLAASTPRAEQGATQEKKNALIRNI